MPGLLQVGATVRCCLRGVKPNPASHGNCSRLKADPVSVCPILRNAHACLYWKSAPAKARGSVPTLGEGVRISRNAEIVDLGVLITDSNLLIDHYSAIANLQSTRCSLLS